MGQFNYAGLATRVNGILSTYGYKPHKAFLRRGGEDREVIAVEADFSPRERDGALVQASDIRFLINSDVAPPPDYKLDKFVIVSEGDDSAETEYLLVTPPKRTAPGGVNVFWQIHCRTK